MSTLVQTVKGKTLGPRLDGHGFIANYNKGGQWKSVDRSQRPVGCQILLHMYRRWADNRGERQRGRHTQNLQVVVVGPWLLELLFDDLVDWMDWLWAERVDAPLGLAVAGSDPCFVPGTNQTQQWCRPSWGMGTLQGARFESLDNSPMCVRACVRVDARVCEGPESRARA